MCKKGFTLVEVLVVVVIIVAVTSFSIPVYKKTQERVKYNQALGVLMQLGPAVKALRADMKMEGLSYSFPISTSYVVVAGTWNGGDTATPNSTFRTARDAATLGALGQNNTKLGYALIARGYMPELPFAASEGVGGYLFRVCPDGVASSSSCCSNNAEVVACMINSSASVYRKAVFYKNGTTEYFS
jgi:prepilin-type N-terminal cleavage/methylation domain-containing protein